jgi:hypothetical protein
MTQSNESTTDSNLPQVVEGLRQFGFSLSKSVKPFRWVGYALLALAILDWLVTFIPPQLNNLLWLFQATGQFIERSPLLLIAFMLIFFAEKSLRASWENLALKIISWFCLVLAIIYFLATVAVGTEAILLAPRSNAQVDAQFQQQLFQATQIEQQVSQASAEEVAAFIQSQGGQVEGTPEEAKEQLLTQLTQAKQELEAQRAAARGTQQFGLMKNAVKWIIGGIISGVLLLYLWRATRWARANPSPKA